LKLCLRNLRNLWIAFKPAHELPYSVSTAAWIPFFNRVNNGAPNDGRIGKGLNRAHLLGSGDTETDRQRELAELPGAIHERAYRGGQLLTLSGDAGP
jgi:hypothetical protein